MGIRNGKTSINFTHTKSFIRYTEKGIHQSFLGSWLVYPALTLVITNALV